MQRAVALAPWAVRLQLETLRPATRTLYLAAVDLLLSWMGTACLPRRAAAYWDGLLPSFMQELYERETPRSIAQRVISALLWLDPQIGRPQAKALPATTATMKGWTRLVPGHSRPPVPWGLVWAIAWHLLDGGEHLSALIVLLLFETYMRPSELFALRRFQWLPLPTAAGEPPHFAGFVIHAEELEVPSKTGEFDTTILLDLPRQRWLVPLVHQLADGRGARDLLFAISQQAFALAFARAVVALQAGAASPTPYGLRHGGASHDLMHHSRSYAAVKGRGAWKSDTSVRRYGKPGTLAMVVGRLSPEARRHLSAAARRSDTAFALRWRALAAR